MTTRMSLYGGGCAGPTQGCLNVWIDRDVFNCNGDLTHTCIGKRHKAVSNIQQSLRRQKTRNIFLHVRQLLFWPLLRNKQEFNWPAY